MKLASLLAQAVFVTSVVAIPSSDFDTRSPIINVRVAGPSSCISTLKTSPPAGTRCGTTGNIAKVKASQNYISSTSGVATVNACADQCRRTGTCGTFSYAGKMCTLYKQTPAQNKFVAGKSTVRWYNPSCFQCTCVGSNQVKQQDGTCSCSTGYIYSTASQSCTQCPSGMVPDSDSTSCVCQGNQQLSTDGESCSCAAGSSVKDSSQPYQCTKDCPQGASLTGTTCTCDQAGYVLSNDGQSCVSQCPSDATFDGQNCQCNDSTEYFNGTACAPIPTCPSDQTFDGVACACVYGSLPNCQPTSCPSDAFPSNDGCQCIIGLLSANGTACSCPQGAVPDVGGCNCIFGVLNNDKSACVDPCDLDGSGKITLPDNTCGCRPSFQEDASGVCVCPSGTSNVGGVCTCPGGQHYSNTQQQCVCPANAQPGTCDCGNNAMLSSDALSCDCYDGFVRSGDGYSCQCPSGLSQCYNSCVDYSSDQFNCGSCANICPLVPSDSQGHGRLYQCVNGQCVP